MDILRPLVMFVGLIVIIVGFMITSNAWMNGAKFIGADTSTGWIVMALGALAVLQGVPQMRARERERMKELKKERRKG